ncbi:hypothetical protein EK21DRAFT_53148 [Setomelanomma holmii]|uniref:Uncharacterized protein n=1 Tax=Setomelanomma holmii TaxID=210430 RepID=A0A9P4HLN1_9PLEO|nr:hypothetical protein EK21DRAFT_53148 [Setomelanomma holmii]
MTSHSWLSRYANASCPWRQTTSPNGIQSFKRPLGLVETSFDIDGTRFCGRADMTATLKLEVRHSLSERDLRGRIALAWCLLRLHHVLLMARIEEEEKTGVRRFVVDVPQSAEDAVKSVEDGITFLEDFGYGPELDDQDLHHHALNVARIIRPEECLSKLHVLPLKRLPGGQTWELKFLIVMAHQISDGLSAYNWFSHFLRILNTPAPTILGDINTSIQIANIQQRLPPAQEDLYPIVPGTRARQRWFWALIRVLRHVQHTMSPTFTNPLRRETRLEGPLPIDPTYTRFFNYDAATRPQMNSGHITPSLSPAASARLIALCREAKVSIGAGCFALAGLSMMAIHESRYSQIAVAERPAFGASFPLNPRAFFGVKTQADSCMLAFSEGIVMPLLTSSLPIEGRFKLVAKHANRELKVYQKRLKDGGARDGMSVLNRHSPGRLLATGYLAQLERVDARLPEDKKTRANPQGELKARVGKYGATCGVSSVGSTAAFFRPGEYDLDNVEGKDFIVDYQGLRMGVRARDNEFLIGSSTDANGIVGFGVSYDENAISQEAAQNWAETISGLLEKGDGSRL